MSRDLEQKRAEALAVARQRLKNTTKRSSSHRLENIEEQLEHYSKKLQALLASKQTDESLVLFEKLIALKAEQVALMLEKEESTYGTLDQEETNKLIHAYNQDCIDLALSVDHLLDISH